ncbi:MAG: chromosomal replication initiator protein DnaA [Pseudomonadota bacterium]
MQSIQELQKQGLTKAKDAKARSSNETDTTNSAVNPTDTVTRGASGTAARRPSGRGAVARAGSSSEAVDKPGSKVRKLLRANLGEEVFTSWFNALEFDSFDGTRAQVSVPQKFLRNWIATHYVETILECCKAEFEGVKSVEVVLREPGKPVARTSEQQANNPGALNDGNGKPTLHGLGRQPSSFSSQHNGASPSTHPFERGPSNPNFGRTQVGGFEGSPLDPRYTFSSFVVGSSNRIAHAAATRVAEAVLGESAGFNPLFMHAAVGHGKTHLLHAIAWEVKQRKPQAQVLYLTAEGFRYRFVEALRSQDPLAFKENFRQVDILLIDDLEFMQGEKTEQEFDHIINALLDGGRQVVVASARPPAHIERMNERMRSRLQRGLVTEIGSLDEELRMEVLRKRLDEKRQMDPTFKLGDDVMGLLANQLTENGRELEGAITRLFANWHYMRTPITMDIAETVIRDLVQGLEPRRIKIEDILRYVSRHFGVSKSDLLSQRRHRSVVWPRQIGMYLAKQMTSRSLPEIGRRFGGRDHTTVLHAIRKIEGELAKNQSLNEEIDELRKMISH